MRTKPTPLIGEAAFGFAAMAGLAVVTTYDPNKPDEITLKTVLPCDVMVCVDTKYQTVIVSVRSEDGKQAELQFDLNRFQRITLEREQTPK